jgi:hypothetical protein
MRALAVWALPVVLALAGACVRAPAVAETPAAPFPAVWLNAAPASADFLDLFRRPELWARARPRIQVVHFRGHSVGCQIDNAMRERSGNGPCVAPLRQWGLSGRPSPAAAAPRSPLLPCRPGVRHAACRCGAN